MMGTPKTTIVPTIISIISQVYNIKPTPIPADRDNDCMCESSSSSVITVSAVSPLLIATDIVTHSLLIVRIKQV